jgi:hypothetical protein
MANLQLPFGVKVLGQQALDAKYLNDGVPYVSIAEANTILSSGVRSIGLTVNINFVDFHYKDDITDEGLIVKTVDVSTKEDLSNKQNNLNPDGTGLKYTTVDAVKTHTDDIANPHNVTKAQVGLSNASDTSDADKPVSTANQEALDLKLNTADYNDRFKGVYLTLASLNSTHPTGVAGEYAQVNESGATEVLNYNWDVEESAWVANAVQGFSANNTDELPEGSSNLYYTTTRVLATILSGFSLLTGSVTSADSFIQAFGKFQKQINDIITALGLKANTADLSQNLRFQTVWNTGDSQTFTLPNTFYQIQEVIVQGISLKDTQYTTVGNTQVTINDTLGNGEYVIILYGTNASSNSATYYTQAQVDAKDSLKVDVKYKVYTALLNQTSTDAPISTILENTLGGTVVWSRYATGSFKATLSGVFTLNKTWVVIGNSRDLTGNIRASLSATNSNDLFVTSLDQSTDANIDGVMQICSIEIRVYN